MCVFVNKDTISGLQTEMFKISNEYNKMEIPNCTSCRAILSRIKLVITNHTPASRSCDFVITRLISDQIAQFNYHYISLGKLS